MAGLFRSRCCKAHSSRFPTSCTAPPSSSEASRRPSQTRSPPYRRGNDRAGWMTSRPRGAAMVIPRDQRSQRSRASRRAAEEQRELAAHGHGRPATVACSQRPDPGRSVEPGGSAPAAAPTASCPSPTPPSGSSGSSRSFAETRPRALRCRRPRGRIVPLLEATSLNGVDPRAWLVDVITRLPNTGPARP